MKQLIDRTGEVSQTKRGETIKIVSYNGSNDIDYKDKLNKISDIFITESE